MVGKGYGDKTLNSDRGGYSYRARGEWVQGGHLGIGMYRDMGF